MKRVILAALSVVGLAAGLTAWAYHEYSYGNNVNPSALGQGAADGASSRELVAVGWYAGCNALEAIQDVFIGNSAGRESGNTQKAVGIGYNALGDAHDIKNVVAIGNYELAGISGVTNTTSINNGQLFISETYDVAMIRPNCYAAPTNSPFAYIAGDTYIGGTGTTYIAGNVVFGGRTVVQDNSYVGGGGATARLAGSGDLANLSRIPFSSGDCDLFVSARGSDTADGSLLRPFLTLNRALQEVVRMTKGRVTIGVMAGDYAYPSNAIFQAAVKSAIVTLVGLEGVTKTSMSLTASGIDRDVARAATTNSTLAISLRDRAVLTLPEEGDKGMAHVWGFTFDGRTKATRSTLRGTYSGIQFHSCRFTGIDACNRRNYKDMLFANAILDNCLIDEQFEVNVRTYQSTFNGSPFFACGIQDSIILTMRKHLDGNFASPEGDFMKDSEVYNSLIVDTKNVWRTALYYSVTDYGLYDCAFACAQNMTYKPIQVERSKKPTYERIILAVGTQTAKGAVLDVQSAQIVDSYMNTYATVQTLTDKNFYPLDEALELFGIGYNNGLTRKFKDYLREKHYQGRDGVGIIDLKNTDALLMKAENGVLNIYTVTAVSNNVPVRPLFALFKAEQPAGNDVIASTSLSDGKYPKTLPDFGNFNYNHVTPAAETEDEE